MSDVVETAGEARLATAASRVLPLLDGWFRSQGLVFHWRREGAVWSVAGPLQFPDGSLAHMEQRVAVLPDPERPGGSVLRLTIRVEADALSAAQRSLLAGMRPAEVAASWAAVVDGLDGRGQEVA